MASINCAVCQEICTHKLIDNSTIKTICNHYFHRDCLALLFKSNSENSRCPLCRRDIKYLGKIQPVYKIDDRIDTILRKIEGCSLALLIGSAVLGYTSWTKLAQIGLGGFLGRCIVTLDPYYKQFINNIKNGNDELNPIRGNLNNYDVLQQQQRTILGQRERLLDDYVANRIPENQYRYTSHVLAQMYADNETDRKDSRFQLASHEIQIHQKPSKLFLKLTLGELTGACLGALLPSSYISVALLTAGICATAGMANKSGL